MITNELDFIISQMLLIYKPNNFDWMGIELTRKNQLSYMMISNSRRKFFKGDKKKNALDIKDFALVSVRGLVMLEEIRKYYPQLFDEYMFMFQIINDMKCPPTIEIMTLIFNMKKRLEAALQGKAEGVFIKRFKP